MAQDSSARKPAAPPDDTQESSSRDTHIDTTPPKDDAKSHPNSEEAVSDLTAPPPSDSNSDVQEFHPWNPYKANKDIQIGDFYYHRKNYKGALERYKDALYYKQNDAVATFRAGECEEKLGNKEEAKKYFEQYLKILPDGPQAKEAHNSIAKLEKAK
jgi:tetratricopeptide (TPR) repeat protein